MKADLHTHTKHSDGTLSVQELAAYKKKEGFSLIAITDHDNVDGYQQIKQKTAIPVLLGVELSTYYRGENIHLLGYFKKNKTPSKAVQKFLKEQAQARCERVFKIIELLKEQKIEIQYEDVLKYADGAVARPHIAKAIQEKYNLSWEEIFNTYLGDDCPCYVPTKYFSFLDALSFLHENDAIAVVAHPHYLTKNRIEDLIPFGLDGIEIHYPTMSLKQQKKFLKLAKKENLLVTGGSDFHEKQNEKKEVYPYGLEGDELQKFLQKLEVRIDDWK